jgi:ParB family transcriptional regulator, chromosome partitioning protein
MSRKDTLRTMLTRREDRLPDGNPGSQLDSSSPVHDDVRLIQHVRAGAVGAMGRSLGQIAHAAEQARAIIANGATVIEIPADRLDESFVSDRLEREGAEFEVLVEAIREAGQRSPILVRPHPDKAERYQIVFGHRRARAAARLGRPVRAVVQSLTDEELVVAQGQENSARTDLSYIERGQFAAELESRGFDRRVIMMALGMEKTQLSKLLSVVHAIPRPILVAIGPAPKTGRPRWESFAARLADTGRTPLLDEILSGQDFAMLASDARFLRVFAAVGSARSSDKAQTSPWLTDDGRRVATIERSRSRLTVVVDETAEPEFGEFLAGRLTALHREFREQKRKGET